jgi:aryl-alcohol dehydrogenase-like predicted oxidoreductase
MRYKLLGKSGLRVSELCLGTMTFGETWGWGASRDESRKQFDLFLDRGGNFIDTSVNYTDGASETLLGEFIQEKRASLVIATKYSLTKPDSGDPNSGGNSRKNMRQSVERSLKRLQTDFIDLLYLHMWDYMTPVEEVLRGLDDLVRAGKVLYIAISDSPAWVVAEANTRAELLGWSRFVAYQVPYSLLDRAVERDVLPTARHWDMAVLPWGILEAGILSGKFLKPVQGGTRIDPQKLDLPEKAQAIVAEVQKIAAETGRSMAQVAVNWVRQQQGKAQMIPILGARTALQLEDNLGVLEWSLSEEQLQRLDAASQIELGFPHSMLPGNRYLFGATFDKIDNHRR